MIDVISANIKEVKIIESKIHIDERGYFFESFNQNQFHKKIGKINFIQDNESKSSFGVLRGLHFQKAPYEQSKLVRVIKGEIQDVIVDIRQDSDSYLKHTSIILNEKNKKQVFIPKGFAHGFLVLSDEAIVNYKVDNIYNLKSESGLSFNDSRLNIEWKLSIDKIKISKKDMRL
jgi:dTDP-4-dehydrorhamnose 3,5-epimerase